LRPLYEDHAFTSEELHELRRILKMKGDPQLDVERLQAESDKFAILIGWWVKGERQISNKERIEQVRDRLLRPCETMLEKIDGSDFRKEFSQSWGRLTETHHATLEKTLRATIAAAKAHIATLESHLGRGKTWHHDLKRLHVRLAACFCEYCDNEFEPSRRSDYGKERSTFQEAVELLAKPIFPDNGTGFSGAVRKHIDKCNAAKQSLGTNAAADFLEK
jgi:hypothetical protein